MTSILPQPISTRPLSSPLSRPRVTSANTLATHPSPKRARQTPSLSTQTPDSPSTFDDEPSSSSSPFISSTRPRTRVARPSLSDKRSVTFERYVTTTSHSYTRGSGSGSGSGRSGTEVSGSGDDRRLARRRELSVPLLSQSLSHFSLAHTSPPTPHRQPSASIPMMSELYSTRPSEPTKTPRKSSKWTEHPLGPPSHSELSYPSTAPLPHASTFLGSPFSSKTSRGQYRFSGSDESPSRAYGAKTEWIAQGAFGKQLEWMHGSEWMAETEAELEEGVKGEMSPLRPFARPARIRRDTSGSSSSTASIDEFSCSGASSASLRSLGRSSDEHRVRPSVTIWGEHQIEEETRPETPQHHYLVPSSISDDALQISVKAKKASPSSISGSAKGKMPQYSPLQHFMTRPSSKSITPTDEISAAKARKSPFSNFFPRLMSVRRPTLSRTRSKSTPTNYDEDEATDTEDVSSPCNRVAYPSTSTVCDSPTTRAGAQPTLVGLGISSASKGDSSFSSESSIELPSPSKPPSGRNSHAQLSSLILSPGPLPTSGLARRKTLALPEPPLADRLAHSTRTMERAKPMRPFLRRGITAPGGSLGSSGKLLGPESAHTPPSALFDDVKPSPAAFASTGLVKKKSTLPILQIPKFGAKSSPASSRSSELSSHQSSRSARVESSRPAVPLPKPFAPISKPIATIGHGIPAAVQTAQRSRGLRRKGSTMFTSSGSIGSIGDCKGLSPVTPTKPTFQITPMNQVARTPTPATPTSYYPFAASASVLSITTPTSSTPVNVSPKEVAPLSNQAVPARMREHKGPVARASNPMLAAAYKADKKLVDRKDQAGQNRLDRDFILVQSLGAGAFSQVWKVKDKVNEKMWAVKAGKPYTGVKSRLRQLEEVSILHSLSLNPNPHIINYVDSWEHRNRLYLRTELAECGDLSRFLEALGDAGGLGEIRCWKLLSELSIALSHVHSHNIIHLDVKPSNVLITRNGSVKLADFGMSTISDISGRAADLSPALPGLGIDGGFIWSDEEEGEDETEFPKQKSDRPIETVPSPIIDREVEGDREYLCPEALEDGIVGRESDIFSLGILILESILNVVLPSNGEGWIKLRNNDFSDLTEHYECRKKTGDWRLVNEFGLPVISEKLLEVVKGMMRSDREIRWRLSDVVATEEMRRVKVAMEDKKLGSACVEEDMSALEYILGA